ncbi:hypothetical protein L1987_37680 [Smallanthus sonchifolius]|uniref:Uncharacterized protein n=1 Tax=Smallanthus sonchifolius TaxID=185202 RepID=A0ACB9HHS2_9ASTR|nr:hypothetical protein L1987_37680 [Smallanthus sonchifolius]
MAAIADGVTCLIKVMESRLDCGNNRSVDAGKWIRKHNRFELRFDSVVGGFIGEFLLREPAGGGRKAIGAEEG